MRFIVAIVSFVVAFAMIGYGIAQRTVLAEPDRVVAETELAQNAPIALIDGSVLNSLPGRQKLEVSGEGPVFAAYGRTTDVEAWVGDAGYTRVGFDAETTSLTTKAVRGGETEVPDPRGSDLWLDQYMGTDELTFVLNVPSDISVILMTDGVEPAPEAVALSWPVDNRMPWAMPLIIAGVVLLLVGIGLYIWALAHVHRSRGPRRKQPKQPRPPRRQRYKPGKLQTPVVAPRGRRAAGRMSAVVPTLVIGGVILAGCSATPLTPASSVPGPTVSSIAADTEEPEAPESPPTAVTPAQLSRIMTNVSMVVTEADANRDASLAATRLAGPALELRSANYEIRGKDSEFASLAKIPSGELRIVLPQQTESWPRTVFVVAEEASIKTVPAEPSEETAEAEAAEPEKSAAPVALMLVQESPRDNYKVHYAVELTAGVIMPEVAAREKGTARLRPDVKILSLAPEELAAAYGDIVLRGEESEHWELFDMENDPLFARIGKDAKAQIASELPAIASISFTNAPGEGEVIALATEASGAIVAVHIKETETVEPVEEGATVSTSGTVRTLAGVSSTTKGTIATYSDLLLFHVPASTSGAKIRLLGYSVQLVAAQELG